MLYKNKYFFYKNKKKESPFNPSKEIHGFINPMKENKLLQWQETYPKQHSRPQWDFHRVHVNFRYLRAKNLYNFVSAETCL